MLASSEAGFIKMHREKLDTQLGEVSFMVKQGIVLGHEISNRGIKVDRSKVEVIAKLPETKCLKDIKSFLEHAGFYRRFIKEFSKIARPLTNLLGKDVSFNFDEECLKGWEELKHRLVSAPIISVPDWTRPFKIMCDASDYAIGLFSDSVLIAGNT